MLILVKLLAKYDRIIYALGSVHEKFAIWIKAIPKSLKRRNSQLISSKLKQAFLIDSDAEVFMYVYSMY